MYAGRVLGPFSSTPPHLAATGEVCPMKISNRRIALLAGVSVGAVGYAAPAFAATTTNPGVCQSQTAANVAETLDITLVGDTGVTSVNNPANATVSGCATGAIVQGGHATAGDV